MPDIHLRLGRDLLVIEGAMGTMLHRAEIAPGVAPESLNVLEPEIIEDIHRRYLQAGADCIVTNSFGGTRVKLDEYGLGERTEELNRAAVRIAKSLEPQHVLADVGPTGLVMEPLGGATFDEVFDLFVEQISALVAEEPDAVLIETMTDIAEARCALLAARSVTDLPVIVTCTFGGNGRMDLSGTDPETAAVILEAAGASAVGVNCGLGPDQMFPMIEAMAAATDLPLVVQPNAGMPKLDALGRTVYPGTPDEMAYWAERYRAIGAAMIGSCCGSDPSFTGAIYGAVGSTDVVERTVDRDHVVVASPRATHRIGRAFPVTLIGERINPTGKPQLADSLREGSMSVVHTLASAQERAGAHLLDVNVGAPGVDAAAVLPKAVIALSGAHSLPLVIDTTDRAALEAALRVYPGKALVNSVSGEDASIAETLPLVAYYGAAVVVLALDDDGIPATAEDRIAVVEKVRAAAREHGIADHDLVVDSLVMTAAAEPEAPAVTIETQRRVFELGLASVLGVSNVSHGLPARPRLNAAFISAAIAAGLDSAIVNPNDTVVVDAVRAASTGRGPEHVPVVDMADWDVAYADAMSTALGDDAAATPSEAEVDGRSAAERLADAVRMGDPEAAAALVDDVIADGVENRDVIPTILTPAIQELGDAFGRGEVFLPQLMVAASAMKAAVERVRELSPADAIEKVGEVVFATVKGDIHSIGKDICVSILESQGFEVADLGVDVDPGRVVDAASSADAVCLSALMTTTLPAMDDTVSRVRQSFPDLPVFVGGAVVTADWAARIGAGYAPDAPSCAVAVREAIVRRGSVQA